MNKVTTINLNGRAYQLEEGGYAALRAYLDDAAARLANDPGKDEIIADLEQAIAEKCDVLLNSHKTVVTVAEVTRIIEEMGPVEGAKAESAASDPAGAPAGRANDADGATAGDATQAGAHTPKRLYRVQEGAMIWGICTGLAAFFGIDVTLVRIIFVVLAIITGGGFCLAYFIMMLVIPEADTMQEKAAAHGEPFNAQELVNRVKQEYERFSAGFGDKQEWKKWKNDMKHQGKQWKRQWKHGGYTPSQQQGMYSYRPNPLLGILKAALAVIWILALISLITTGGIFGWMVPAAVPVWLAIIVLFVLYHMVTGPMRAAHYSRGWNGDSYAYDEWSGIGDGLTVLFLVIAFGWAYLHLPGFDHFVHHPIAGMTQGVTRVRSWFHR